MAPKIYSCIAYVVNCHVQSWSVCRVLFLFCQMGAVQFVLSPHVLVDGDGLKCVDGCVSVEGDWIKCFDGCVDDGWFRW